MIPWLLLLASYLLGATPTSYLIARSVRGIDLREHGSGNLGATNAFRVLGWKAATPIFLFDIFKGWLPAALFPLWDGVEGWAWPLAYGAAAVIGHVFSIYVGFRGGKGVATGAGVFLALAPTAVLAGLAVWLLLVFTTGYVSLASITAAVVLPVAVLIVQGANPIFYLALVLAAFVIYAHRSNVRRLLRGEEHRFRRKAGADA
ncbi:MAG: glycerol-3-phosphate 1-O-acyltransferase PlsY [Candidatus Cloacimonetes bacterium]|jgi:glycerol-3-phosphate acyltransferase PlsY|nr:glycerol-3-phosphate 1-O-acyltransferase PlsY [Candidatus Cloacimonadota bacterium]